MWCLNCGRKQPSKAGFCQHCGEPKTMFSPEKPRVPDSVLARNLHVQSAAYYFMVLFGLVLVVVAIATVAVYAVNMFQLIMRDEIAMSAFRKALTVQKPFVTIFSVVSRLVVLGLGAATVVAGIFTRPIKRRVLLLSSGGLQLLWLLLDLFGIPDKMSIGLVMGAMILMLPPIVGYIGHPYLSKSAIGAVVRVAIAVAAMYLIPVLFRLIIDVLFNMFNFGEFTALCDPFFAVVSLTAIAVTQVSAISRVSLFYTQIPDMCHARRVKKPAPQQAARRAPAAQDRSKK